VKTNGFTLVELLVSLLIFGMLSAAAVGLLTVSVRAQDMASERLDRLAEIRRFGAIVTSDLAQAAPRVPRDMAGVPQRAFEGGTGQARACRSRSSGAAGRITMEATAPRSRRWHIG
jgi:general secretion pathway protein J